MELIQAIQVAQNILDSLHHHGACDRAQIAGSIRRQKPNVKDIEIVAIVRDYESLFKALAEHGCFIKPGVPNVIPWAPKPGSKYIRMLLNGGIKLDLFVANPDNWGSLLFMRTGPAVAPTGEHWKAFVPAAFKRWKKLSGGGKMVNCQPTMPDGLELAVPEEEDFFAILGLNWIEPWNRIDSSSIKAAVKSDKPTK